MAGPGGARPGAGRPRKREKYAGAINKAEKRIADRLPEVADRMLELAMGVRVQEEDEDGAPVVYTKPPDREAAKYLLDRIMGKPKERQEQEHSGGLVIRVQYDDDYAQDAAPASGAAAGAE